MKVVENGLRKEIPGAQAGTSRRQHHNVPINHFYNAGATTSVGKSYLQATLGKDHIQEIPNIVVNAAGLAPWSPSLNVNKMVIFKAKSMESLSNVSRLVYEAGVRGTTAAYVGGLYALVNFYDSESPKLFLSTASSKWEEDFVDVMLWTGKEELSERIAKVRITGVPFQFRDGKVFDKIREAFGAVIFQSDFTWDKTDLSSGSCIVLTDRRSKIQVDVTLECAGASCIVNVSEEDFRWCPKFWEPSNTVGLGSDELIGNLEEGELRPIETQAYGSVSIRNMDGQLHGDVHASENGAAHDLGPNGKSNNEEKGGNEEPLGVNLTSVDAIAGAFNTDNNGRILENWEDLFVGPDKKKRKRNDPGHQVGRPVENSGLPDLNVPNPGSKYSRPTSRGHFKAKKGFKVGRKPKPNSRIGKDLEDRVLSEEDISIVRDSFTIESSEDDDDDDHNVPPDIPRHGWSVEEEAAIRKEVGETVEIGGDVGVPLVGFEDDVGCIVQGEVISQIL
ncbi:hypothetical protein L1987_34340 [Smallanthus sonchifolius]|uniref:Uncharacterized protein n=1 Tax=Smallanthus sonchifolius TaxID=185202 RepID=A0ACB9HUS5_9ASTR|nr:hypothetical protein L1987_34340 [Smallanthus sonchifolius]